MYASLGLGIGDERHTGVYTKALAGQTNGEKASQLRRQPPQADGKGDLKQLLKNVIWCFVHEAIFREPFRSGGDSFVHDHE